MKEIQLSHTDGTHITTITEYELQQVLNYAKQWSLRNYVSNKENKKVQNTVDFIRMSLSP